MIGPWPPGSGGIELSGARTSRPLLESVASPKQARSERTLHRLLDAAEALIEEKGLHDVSVPEIVQRAGSSVGGFYARFRDKNELLRALEERFFREQRGRVEALTGPARWRRAPLAEVVRRLAAELVGVCREREALIHAFVARAVHDVEFRGSALRFRRGVAERVADFLLERPEPIRHPHPRLAVELGVQIVFSAVLARVVFGEVRAAGKRLDDATLARELTRNFLAYLGIDGATARAGRTP